MASDNAHRASTSDALYAHTSASHRPSTIRETSEFVLSEKSQPEPRPIAARQSSPARARYPPAPTAPREGEEEAEIGGFWGFFLKLPPKVRLWLSFGAWIATTVGVFLAVAFWRTEVFTGLDNLSLWLVKEKFTGYLIMFSLIVLTTVRKFCFYS